MPINTVYVLITAVAGISIGIMGICLMTVAMPRDKRLANYRISRFIFATGYLAISAACLLAMHADVSYAGRINPMIVVMTLVTAALQAFLFQHTMLTLVNPMYLTARRVLRSLIPILAAGFAFSASYLWGGERLFRAAFFIAYGLYFLQMIIYVRRFRREYGDYVVTINNYFADDDGLHLKWIVRAYYPSVLLGIVAAVAVFLPVVPFMFFIGVVAVFYVYYAVRYIGYARVFPRMAPALESVPNETDGPQASRDEVAAKIGEWIAAKKFTQPGITPDSISEDLGLPRSAISLCLRRRDGRSFRRWINELRVDEAREVMIACPEMPLHEVGERAGFRNLRSFVRSFESVEGEEPRYFRERIHSHIAAG